MTEEVLSRADLVERALERAGDTIAPDEAQRARRLLERSRDRTALSTQRTVVALAGATGSGKSSLFNALIGDDVANVGAQRPTTTSPVAAVWGDEDASGLLDWMDVSRRHNVAPPNEGAEDRIGTFNPEAAALPRPTPPSGGLRGLLERWARRGSKSRNAQPVVAESAAPADPAIDEFAKERFAALDGLILLDMPDLDSTTKSNIAEANRLLEMADIFVWVTDPQKYADSRLHDDYLRSLRHHEGVTYVVLNQADRLDPVKAGECLHDLEQLVNGEDGDVTVLATSVATGQGLEELADRLGGDVQAHSAAGRRLTGDLIKLAKDLRTTTADTESSLSRSDSAALVGAMEHVAGVPTVSRAVERDHRRRAFQATGWPFTRWTTNLRPDPVKQLRLTRGNPLEGKEVTAMLDRSSLPSPSPAQRAQADVEARKLAHTAAEGLPPAWAERVHRAATPKSGDVADKLDQAVLSTPIPDNRPAWWTAVGILQWVLAAAAVVGAIWTVLLVVGGLVNLDIPGSLILSIVLVVVGIVGGIALSTMSRALAEKEARRVAKKVREQMRSGVEKVVRDDVMAPMREVLTQHRKVREDLDSAAQ